MIDYIAEVSYDASDAAAEERLQSLLFVSAASGSFSVEANGTATLSAYFDSPDERTAFVEEIADDVEVRLVDRERIDWLATYQQSLHALPIGSQFMVAPDRSLLAGDRPLELEIPQEQAFGTGSHETTSLCIELLETLEVRGERALDIGAGSGILALAMCLLGAQKVIAFDNDPDAYGALRDNRMRNGVSEQQLALFIGGTDALRRGTFDVVTMNIIPEVILPLLPDVVARLAADARLVLSGILVVRRDDVVNAAAALGLSLIDERERGEWWAGVFA